MHGRGKLENPSGSFYEGEFLNNDKHGQGDFKWDSKRRYIGGWMNGAMHGNGELYNVLENGKTIVRKGVWARGKRIKWVS